MELQLLLVLLGAAAASLLVAAALGMVLRSTGPAQRWSGLRGLAAILVGVLIGSRVGTEQWPTWPPGQARAWWVYVVAAAAAAWAATMLIAGRRAGWLGAGLAGAAAGGLMVAGPLAGVIGRMEVAGERWGWRAAAILGMVVVAAAAHAAVRAREESTTATSPRPGPLARLRDEHALTVGLGLLFGLSGLGVLFTASSMTLCLLMLSIAAAWGGLAIVAWLIKPGLDLGGAAVAAAVGYAAVWMIAYFFGQEGHLWVLAVALGAPAAVLALARSRWLVPAGGWARWGAVVGIAAAAAMVVPLTFGPEYVRTIPDAASSEYP